MTGADSLRLAAAIVATTSILATGSATPGDNEVAGRIFEKSVPWSSLESASSPVDQFAAAVQDRLARHLASVLEIDISDENIRKFIVDTTSAVPASQRKRDQEVAGQLASALELVFEQDVPIDDVFESLALSDMMTEEQWRQVVSTSEPEHIDTLRKFADADTSALTSSQATVESYRFVYLTRQIRDKVCFLPDRYAAIRKRILELANGDTTDPILKEVGIFEFECSVETNAYIREALEEHVEIYRPELVGFESRITLLESHADRQSESKNFAE